MNNYKKILAYTKYIIIFLIIAIFLSVAYQLSYGYNKVINITGFLASVSVIATASYRGIIEKKFKK